MLYVIYIIKIEGDIIPNIYGIFDSYTSHTFNNKKPNNWILKMGRKAK